MTLSRIRLADRVLRCALPAASVFAGLACIAASQPANATEPLSPKKPAASLQAPLAVRWKFTGSYFSNNPARPALGEGVLVFTTGNRVYAVDPSTGTQKWRYPKDTTLTSNVLNSPAIANGAVYFGTGDGLYALNLADGSQKWAHFNTKLGVVTSPIVLNGSVFFGSGDQRLYALNASTGEPLMDVWSTGKRAGRDIGGDFAGDLAYANDHFYFVTADQALRAVNALNGNLRWAQRLGNMGVTVTPVVAGENVYVAVGDNVGVWRASSGQSKLNINIGSEALTPPAIDGDGNIYVINGDRRLLRFDQRGRPQWRQLPQLDHEAIAAPTIAGDMVVVGTALGGIYGYDRIGGQLKWHYLVQPSSTVNSTVPLSTNIASSPIVSNDALFVLSDDGAVTAFDSASPDGMSPIVTVVEPQQGEYLNGRPPFKITARVVDEGSGLDLSSLQLQIDNKSIPRRPSAREFSEKPGFTYDTDYGFLEYTLLENDSGQRTTLSDGHHIVTLTAKDWRGNTIVKKWNFYVDDTIRPKARRNQNNQPGNGTGSGRGAGGAGGGGKGAGGGGN